VAQPRDFGFGSDEALVRDQARKLLRDEAPVDRLRTLVAADHRVAYESDVPPAAWNEALWGEMVQLGWPALLVPEAAGGLGMKMVAVASIAEEIGRAAVPSPLPATLCATAVLRAAGPPAHDALGKIAAGAAATLAVAGRNGSWEPADVPVTRAADGALAGEAWFVQDARKASLLVVASRGAEGVQLHVVAANAPGVTVLPDRVVDLTRDQARVRFEGARGDLVAADGAAALEAALPAILVLLAADACGAAEWQLQTTAEYARVRTQFDRPIGFFQAVKHPIVNMMVAVDRARSLLYAAACAVDEEPEDALRLARMAKAAASDAAAFCSDRSVQLHGGIGFTWECDVHLWFKRQRHTQFLWGDGLVQRAKLAAMLEAGA
jgi:alkylation response protein AidB-like acyl-CoA dehydrogenase